VDEKSHIWHRRDTHVTQLWRYRRLMAAKGAARGRKAATKAATPWGDATVVDEVTLQQRAGERRFTSLVQLLEDSRGERLVRFAYATEGSVRRGPVTLRLRDLVKLHDTLSSHPELAETLARGGL
jgi:hypothetical protein